MLGAVPAVEAPEHLRSEHLSVRPAAVMSILQV
jgi:hypothetical protein